MRKGFTLIELLIVIAIIALLIGLTLPGLKGARAAARQTGCLSDMRQMGVALNLYVNDHRDSLPYPNWGPVAQVKGWLYGPGVDTSKAVAEDRQTGSLWPYLEDGGVYRCPSHLGPYEGTANLTSFIMNGAIVGYGRLPAPARVFQFDSDAVMLWDGNEQPEFGPPYNDGASFPREIVPGHHGKSVTCLRTDASSQAFTETEFFEKRNATTRNAFWCAPGRPDGR
jgi:prepilin-type N-terminal cleavage/methylation domain-containing protein